MQVVEDGEIYICNQDSLVEEPGRDVSMEPGMLVLSSFHGVMPAGLSLFTARVCRIVLLHTPTRVASTTSPMTVVVA